MRLSLLLLLMMVSGFVSAQSFKTSKNIVSVGLYTPFESPAGYALSYERMLDRGNSPSAAQFAFKLNMKMVNDKEKAVFTNHDGKEFFDEDAFQYNGFVFTPEVKYYFGWNAPFGVYFSVNGGYGNYVETFYDVNNVLNNYEKRYSRIGRGIGAGFQFMIRQVVAVDLGGGYLMEDVSLSQRNAGEKSFSALYKEKDDGLRINVTFGIPF
jgi:hypothetical protein